MRYNDAVQLKQETKQCEEGTMTASPCASRTARGSTAPAMCAYAVSGFLREHRNRVVTSAKGLLVQLWCQRAHFVPWESITAVVWTHRWGGKLGMGYAPRIHAREEQYSVKPWGLGYCHFELSEDLAQLRDEIIVRAAA